MLEYRNHPVLASDAATREGGGVTVRIGPPEIAAAKDDAPDEGTFVGPRLHRFGDDILLNWSFDWDVVDADVPEKPNGRISRDGGRSWEKQQALRPSGAAYQTGEREVSCWGGCLEVPGRAGVYRAPVWRSPDLGRTWSSHAWTPFAYPGTKGLDYYDPPEAYRKRDGNYLRGGVKATPPARLEPFFREVSRLRGPKGFHTLARHPDGTLFGMVYARYLKDTSGIHDWDRDYWTRLNWQRYAVLLQVSHDNGRTWTFGGVPVNGADYEPRVGIKPDGSPYNENDFIIRSAYDPVAPGFKARIDFAPGDGFSEPSLVIFPDGEMLCAVRTGGNKPLYGVRSTDGGQSWTDAERLSPRYVSPICGVNPKLVLLKNGILALATGRPDCTVHFSKDRGRTWFLSETLFSTTGPRWPGLYSGSHTNVAMTAVNDHTLLYAHDATRPDPSAPNAWLRKAGHGLIITRRIEVHP